MSRADVEFGLLTLEEALKDMLPVIADEAPELFL